mgnify:CR=1 FL=1
MKILNKRDLIYLLFFLFVFGFTNCKSNKIVKSNKDFVINATNPKNTFNHSKILYLVNKKEVSEEYLRYLKPNTIASVTVIKDKKEIKKYSNKTYEGVIIIQLKNK